MTNTILKQELEELKEKNPNWGGVRKAREGKKLGRPPEGDGARIAIGMRFSEDFVAKLDAMRGLVSRAKYIEGLFAAFLALKEKQIIKTQTQASDPK